MHRFSWATGLTLAGLLSYGAATLGAGADTKPPTDPALASLPQPYPDGTRPGPDVLYAPPPAAPQLENRDPRFVAAPLLVSGAEAYEYGEYLYQGYLYADHGGGNAGGGPGTYAGTLTYPTNLQRYGNNAANIVEFRVSTLDPANVVYRFTLNTLLAPDTTIATLAYDTDGKQDTGCARLPHDPMAAGHDAFQGTDQVLTTWGTGADYATCNDGKWTVTPVPVTEDMQARQLTVVVPRTVSDPHGTWKATLAAGLYDGNGGWLQAQSTADATHPGGAGSSGPHNGIFDLGFRFNEPAASNTTLPLFSGVGDGPDQRQGAALLADHPEAFQHPIDFDALASHDNRTTVPEHGTQIRMYASRLTPQQRCPQDPTHCQGVDATNHELGQLEPYELQIPESYQPGKRLPFMFALHSATDHYWQYVGSQGLRDWSDGHGQIVATTEGYGTDLFYRGVAEYEVYEVWNDVARHFTLNPRRTAFYGYSMGGVGTHFICSWYPDLCGKAYEVVGGAWTTQWVPPFKEASTWDQDAMLWLENVRHVPILDAWASAGEYGDMAVLTGQNLTPQPGFETPGLHSRGYRYQAVHYPVGEHLTIAGAGYRIPAEVPFLKDTTVERDVAHVSYAYLPEADVPSLGLVHNHAYWVSGVHVAGPHMHDLLLPQQVVDASGGELQDANNAAKASVDAVSAAFGEGDPTATPFAGAGIGPAVLPYDTYGQTWGAAPSAAKANRLTVSLANVGTVTFDVTGAHLDPSRPLEINAVSSTPSKVTLAGEFPEASRVSVNGAPVDAARDDAGLSFELPQGTHAVVVAPDGKKAPKVHADHADAATTADQPQQRDTGSFDGNGCTAQAGESCSFVADDAFLAQGVIAALDAATTWQVVDDDSHVVSATGAGANVTSAHFTPYHHFRLKVVGGGGVVYAGNVTFPQPQVCTGC